MPTHLTPEIWLSQVFATQAARRGGVVKRKVRDVERLVGRAEFERALRLRGYQAVENGAHFVIFCNDAPIRRVV